MFLSSSAQFNYPFIQLTAIDKAETMQIDGNFYNADVGSKRFFYRSSVNFKDWKILESKGKSIPLDFDENSIISKSATYLYKENSLQILLPSSPLVKVEVTIDKRERLQWGDFLGSSWGIVGSGSKSVNSSGSSLRVENLNSNNKTAQSSEASTVKQASSKRMIVTQKVPAGVFATLAEGNNIFHFPLKSVDYRAQDP